MLFYFCRFSVHKKNNTNDIHLYRYIRAPNLLYTITKTAAPKKKEKKEKENEKKQEEHRILKTYTMREYLWFKNCFKHNPQRHIPLFYHIYELLFLPSLQNTFSRSYTIMFEHTSKHYPNTKTPKLLCFTI